MGLDHNGTKFLLYAKMRGVDFSRTVMIGRQGLHVGTSDLRRNFLLFGYEAEDRNAADVIAENNGFAEGFLQRLGAETTDSFDASSYEGATYIHDFNTPIGEQFKDQYTAVLDGGTLEHVFNFPVAIRNCMEMVKVGGHFLAITPTNNFLGHGFYQFSPELYFRVFSNSNGFQLVDIFVMEDQAEADWFRVSDPDDVKRRVTLVNAQPTYLLVIARKMASTPILAMAPQQSDYAAIWAADKDRQGANTPAVSAFSDTGVSSQGTLRTMIRKFYDLAPEAWKQVYRNWRYPQQMTYYNPRLFHRTRVP